MKIIINKDKLTVEGELEVNSGAIQYYEVDVEFDSSWDELTKKAVIVNSQEDIGQEISIINNKIFLDIEKAGVYFIGFVGYTLSDEVKTYQISTELKDIIINQGSGKIETEEHIIPTANEWEIYIAQIQAMCNQSYTKNETDELLEGKVDKEDGKELSTNDFTDEYKEKVDNNTTARHTHSNKAVLDNTTASYTIEEKTKLAELENYDDTEVKEEIEDLYEQIPKNEVEDIDITLSDSSNLPLSNVELKGNSTQNGTPTPDNEVAITNVTGDVNVKACRDNLLDYTTVENTSNTTITLIENGFKVIGEYAGKITITGLKPNTDYYLQYIRENILGSTKAVKIFEGTRTDTVIKIFVSDTGGTFNTGNSNTINIWFYCSSGTQGEANFTNIKLAEGTIATEYTPYQEQSVTIPLGDIELCKIGNTQDRIYKNNNKWWLEKNVETLIIDETTNISKYNYMYTYNNANIKQNYNVNIMCNYFTSDRISSSLDLNDFNNIDNLANSIRIKPQIEGVNDLITFKQWLSTHNTEVYYELETPVTTEITDTSLITALEQLLALRTYKNITHITNDKNAYLDVTYYKDIESITAGNNYNDLDNKPSVNGVPLVGNKTSNDLGIVQQSDINTAVNTHNSSNLAHSDIRNEVSTVRSIAEGANQAITKASYSEVVTLLNSASNEDYNVGQNIYIKTLEVPDLWLYSIEATNIPYTYTTDTQFINDVIANNGALQIGYYKVAFLETQKVNLTDYYTKVQVDELIPADLADLNEDTTHRTVTDEEKESWNNQIDTKLSRTELVVASGNVSPQANKQYYLAITSDLTITQPVITDNTILNQYLIQLDTTGATVAPTITWNTTNFFGGEVPSIGIGKYDIIAEYDGSNWCIGVLEKGVVV